MPKIPKFTPFGHKVAPPTSVQRERLSSYNRTFLLKKYPKDYPRGPEMIYLKPSKGETKHSLLAFRKVQHNFLEM